MGIYDRDYYQSERQFRFRLPMGRRFGVSATAWLLGINVAVFFLQLAVGGLTDLLICSSADVIGRFQVWRLVTAAFCHAAPGHLFWNMIALFFFGPLVERLWGRRDFVAFYLTAAVLGNLVFVAAGYAGPAAAADRMVLGASGAVVAVVILCAFFYPHQRVMLLFPPIPLPLWALGVLYVAGDLWGMLDKHNVSNVAYSVHLTGAAVGTLFRFVDLRLSTLLGGLSRWLLRRRARRAFRGVNPDGAGDGIPRFTGDVENQRLDRILEKISTFGRGSLSAEELEFLDRMSQRYRGRGMP